MLNKKMQSMQTKTGNYSLNFLNKFFKNPPDPLGFLDDDEGIRPSFSTARSMRPIAAEYSGFSIDVPTPLRSLGEPIRTLISSASLA